MPEEGGIMAKQIEKGRKKEIKKVAYSMGREDNNSKGRGKKERGG